MSLDTITPTPVGADLVYAKTDAGRAELAQRSAKLGARQRSVLIMIDGQKSCAALAALAPQQQLGLILAELEALGFVAPVRPAPPAPVAAAAQPARVPAAAPPTPAASAIDPVLLANAKRMLTATAETYLGLLSAEVVRKVQAAADEEQLLRALGHWHMAMQASKHGRDAAATCLAQIKASLRGAGAERARFMPA